MVRLALLPGLFLAALLAVSWHGAAPSPVQAAEEATYQITLTNISTAQPLSPPILATHSARTTLINVGATAPESLRTLAEEGHNEDLAADWRSHSDVHDVVAADLPILRMGSYDPEGYGATSSARFTIHGGAGDFLTIASMLGCTNDGFTGAISVPLPESTAPMTIRSQVWDAGTELNTEKSLDLPDACGVIGAQSFPEDGNGHQATNETIMNHSGLSLQGDLTQVSAWNAPVLELTIQRLGPSPFVSAAIPPVIIARPPILEFRPPGSGFITSSSTSGDFDQSP